MQHRKLFDDGNHSWMAFGRDPQRAQSIIDTNEYVIMNNGEAMILDPGGTEVFPVILSQMAEQFDLKNVKSYLCSHQDPDIMSSLPLWMALTPDAKIYLSWLWGGFVAHFGNDYANNFELVPDEGMTVSIGQAQLILVPAHHCHSAGNFHLYDPNAKILFSGDMGAALVPPDAPMVVDDFDEHVKYMTKFHKRWMPSNHARDEWLRRVRKLDIDMICPQHGSIFHGQDVKRFLDWIEDLRVGDLAS